MKKTGIGTRVLNFLIDTALISILTYIVNSVWVFYAVFYHIFYLSFGFCFMLVLFVYYLFFEGIFARTPGKWFTISKVINSNGGKPSFFQAIIRSLVRLTVIDCFFIPFLNKPLHDYLSRTDVAEV